MADDFQFWRKVEWLSIHEAALLLCDVNPSINLAANKFEEELYDLEGEFYISGMPAAFESGEQLLIRDIKRDQAAIEQGVTTDVVFKEVQFRDDTSTDINGGTKIKIEAVTKWFQENNFESDFFTVQAKNTGVKKVVHKPEYKTRLMEIMDETIAKFYGENFDPDYPDTHPRQEDIIEWLRANYKSTNTPGEPLSGAEAQTIAQMIRFKRKQP